MHFQETMALMKWVCPDGEQGRIHPLMVEHLANNLLGPCLDLLAQMEVILMTNYQAFFDDFLEKGYWQMGEHRKGNESQEVRANARSWEGQHDKKHHLQS